MNTILENLLKLQSLQFGANPIAAQSQIKQLRAKIPRAMLLHYDRFAARGKHGIAVVSDGVCSGCHLRVPVGTFAALMDGKHLETCDHCDRYLYVPHQAAQEIMRARSASVPLPSPAIRDNASHR